MSINIFGNYIVITNLSGEKFALHDSAFDNPAELIVQNGFLRTSKSSYTRGRLIDKALKIKEVYPEHTIYKGKLVDVRKFLREYYIYIDNEERVDINCATISAALKRFYDDITFRECFVPESEWNFSFRPSNVSRIDASYLIEYCDDEITVKSYTIKNALTTIDEKKFPDNYSIEIVDNMLFIDEKYYCSPGYLYKLIRKYRETQFFTPVFRGDIITAASERPLVFGNKDKTTVVGEMDSVDHPVANFIDTKVMGKISDSGETITFYSNGNITRENNSEPIDHIILSIDQHVEILRNGEIEEIKFSEIKFVRKLADYSIIFALFADKKITRVFRAHTLRFDESANKAVWEKLDAKINKI